MCVSEKSYSGIPSRALAATEWEVDCTFWILQMTTDGAVSLQMRQLMFQCRRLLLSPALQPGWAGMGAQVAGNEKHPGEAVDRGVQYREEKQSIPRTKIH